MISYKKSKGREENKGGKGALGSDFFVLEGEREFGVEVSTTCWFPVQDLTRGYLKQKKFSRLIRDGQPQGDI